jgi:hypothetical protein
MIGPERHRQFARLDAARALGKNQDLRSAESSRCMQHLRHSPDRRHDQRLHVEAPRQINGGISLREPASHPFHSPLARGLFMEGGTEFGARDSIQKRQRAAAVPAAMLPASGFLGRRRTLIGTFAESQHVCRHYRLIPGAEL